MRGKGFVSVTFITTLSLVALGVQAVPAGGAPTANATAHAAASTLVANKPLGGTGSAVPYAGKPPASCDAPPKSADATTANRDRFISLWAPRLADKAWFSNFVQETTVPANIQAEGFNSMDQATQAWLVACLVDNVLAGAGQKATQSQIGEYQLGLDLVIFDKAGLASARQKLSATTKPKTTPSPAPPSSLSESNQKSSAYRLAHGATITSGSLPKVAAALPKTVTSGSAASKPSARLRSLQNAQPQSVPNLVGDAAGVRDTAIRTAMPDETRVQYSADTLTSSPSVTGPTVQAVNPSSLFGTLLGELTANLLPAILAAIAELEQIVANIEQTLFTIPPLNLVGSLFYRVCAESATMSLRCSVLLPIGVPIPADVNGDNLPDVLCELIPYVGGTNSPADLNVSLSVTRLNTHGALPAHVFFVYDPPIIKKRVEFGYDGRASTLANQSNTTVTLHNVYKALTGDIDVSASVVNKVPGSTEALTFAVKDLVGGSAGHQPTEVNPLVGAVQFTPFPTNLTMEAHLTHGGSSGQDEDVFTVQSSTPSTVNAVMDQDTTTTAPQSHRQFTALIDQLPTSVTVDLVQNGGTQTITYNASAPIAHVQATDTDTPDTGQPTSYTQSAYDVLGVPASLKVTLNTAQSAQDVLYQASSSVNQVTFTTQTYQTGVLQSDITAQAQQIPTMVHFTMATGPDTSTYTYNANSVLPQVTFSMYNKSQDQMSVVATATSIPTQLQFTQTQSTGVYDFSANNPIGEIQADLSLGGGSVLSITGEDHATVYKRGSGLGAEFQLSGFQAAHFDGSQKTVVSMVLNPGGQAFQAIADLDSPNVLAEAHVSALPGSMAVTIDPIGGSATYSASSIIPELDGSFTQRDTGTTANFTLDDLPKNITATWAISGSNPQVTYSADSQLGEIQGFYQQAPGGLTFQTTITDLPQYMLISGTSPIVFDARTSAGAASGSSSIGSIAFAFGTDGNFDSAPTTDDHALLDTAGGQTHADVLYHGLAYLSVDTTGGQLHAEVRNSAPRLFRLYLTTSDLSGSGFIDSVPSDVKVDMVGNDIQYHASSTINEIFMGLTRSSGDTISADVDSIPSSIDLTLDAANSQVVWNASSTTGGFSITAHLTPATLGTSRAFDGSLTITSIPSRWSVSYPDGNVDFATNGSGIGQISASVTNHGTVHTLSGDHLSVFYDQTSGNLDASLQISDLHSIDYEKLTDNNGGGFTAGLAMGNGGSLGLSAQIDLGSNSLTATGSFDHLPSVISLVSDGGHITYSGNNNPTLNLAVAAGDNDALAVTPSPNNVNGISIRDGKSGTGIALKANISLTGLPDGLDFNTVTGIYKVTDFAPSVDPLALDVQLTALAPQPLTLEATQVVGTASPVSFTFGPFTSTANSDGSHSMNVQYTSTRDLGAFNAEATYGGTGGEDAQLLISDIPDSIDVGVTYGDGTDSADVDMSHGISEIKASFRYVGDVTFDASADLKSVPSSVHLNIGRSNSQINGGTAQAPDFTYTASAAGLSIEAMATGSIVQPVDATAAFTLSVVGLGSQVTATLNGTDVHITSSPATASFLLDAAADIVFTISLNGSFVGFTNQGSLTVNANIGDLTIGFTGASVLDLNLGITTGLTGDFATFTFGENSDTVINIWDQLSLCIDFPLGIGTQCFGVFSLASEADPAVWNLQNVIDHFHVDVNQEANIFDIPVLEFGFAHCGVNITANPSSYEDSSGSQLTLFGPPVLPSGQDGLPDAYLITPDPSFFGYTLPDFALDAIAFFESPYGNHIGADFGCGFGP